MPFCVPEEEAKQFYYKGYFYDLYAVAAALKEPLDSQRMDAKSLVQQYLNTVKNTDDNWELHITEDKKTTIREKSNFYDYY